MCHVSVEKLCMVCKSAGDMAIGTPQTCHTSHALDGPEVARHAAGCVPITPYMYNHTGMLLIV